MLRLKDKLNIVGKKIENTCNLVIECNVRQLAALKIALKINIIRIFK